MMLMDDRSLFICNDEPGSQGITHSTMVIVVYTAIYATMNQRQKLKIRVNPSKHVYIVIQCVLPIIIARHSSSSHARRMFVSHEQMASLIVSQTRFTCSQTIHMSLMMLFMTNSITDGTHVLDATPKNKNSIVHVSVSLHCVAMYFHSIAEKKELYECNRRCSLLIVDTKRTQKK